jgi:hypothetical protein
MPHLLKSDYRTFLIFFLQDIDPRWLAAAKGGRNA